MKIYLYKLNFLLNKSLFPIFKLSLMISFSIIIGLSIFILLDDYENIRSRIRGYILGYTKIWFWIKAIGIVLFVFMIIYNWDSIFAFLKYKTTPSWFSAIGTISAVLVALSPKLKKSSDLILDFSIEEENKDTFKGKLEISNMLDRDEKIMAYTTIEYFVKDNKKNMILVDAGPDSLTYKEGLLPIFGNKKVKYFSMPLKMNIAPVFSSNETNIIVFKTCIISERDIKFYWNFSVYKIKNNKFKPLKSWEAIDENEGNRRLKDYLELYKYSRRW